MRPLLLTIILLAGRVDAAPAPWLYTPSKFQPGRKVLVWVNWSDEDVQREGVLVRRVYGGRWEVHFRIDGGTEVGWPSTDKITLKKR